MKRLLGLVIVTIALAVPSTASAGTYDVVACADGIGNGSWGADIPGPYATAYTTCPGEGIMTRMSGGAGTAPYGAGARHVFTAPPGTTIVRFRASINEGATQGWYAGLVDSSPRWIWGGANSTTWGQFWGVDLPVRTQQLFAQVTCGNPGGCSRADQYGFVLMRNVAVTVEDNGPPGVSITGGSATTPGWRRGPLDVRFAASDASGIQGVDALLDGEKRASVTGACYRWLARPCGDLATGLTVPTASSGDGPHTVTLRALDAASNVQHVSRRVYIDNTAPTPPVDAAVAGGQGWRSSNDFSVGWTNPPQVAAPLSAARYRICPLSNAPGNLTGCVAGLASGRGVQSLPSIKVPRAGEWRLAIWLEDEAGNADPDRSVAFALRLDGDAPDLAFDATRASDPTRVRVVASDRTSQVAQAWIEARRRGEKAWRSLPTSLDARGFSAVLDDERLPRGRYFLRARAIDLAGNERTIDAGPDGSPVARTLPLRIRTRLAVGKPTRIRARGSHGKKRFRTILVARPRSRYGATIPLRGRLTMPGGNPLASANVEVWEQVKLPGAAWRRVAQVRTSPAGRFRFRALRGPSRLLRFRYAGTPTIRARSTVVDLRVRAMTSLRVTRNRVVNGEEIRFHGRLKGRQRSPLGKLISLHVYTRGRWSTFATARADRRSGAWSVPYRFTATRGTVTYRFRALIPREATFPYETGTSRSVRVTVRGL